MQKLYSTKQVAELIGIARGRPITVRAIQRFYIERLKGQKVGAAGYVFPAIIVEKYLKKLERDQASKT